MEPIIECLYSFDDLQPILDSLAINNQSLSLLIEELVKARVFVTWIIGLNVAIFSVLIIIVFSIFFSNFNK